MFQWGRHISPILCGAILAGCLAVPNRSYDCSLPLDINPEEIEAWIQRGCFEGWASESAVLQATGSDGHAQIFVGPILEESLSEGRTVHPSGSTAVRVMYEPDKETVLGYAVVSKTLNNGAWTWYWYEKLRHQPTANTAGFDVPNCTSCHGSGVDLIHSAWPLR